MSAAHVAAQTAHKYYKRFMGLGWARILLVLGAVFVLVALANPMWAYSTPGPAGSTYTYTFGWTTLTRLRYEGGAWAETLIQSYNAQTFNYHAIANSVGGSYLVALVLLILFIIAIAIFSIEWVHRLPELGLLVIALIVAVFALVAAFFPVITVPSTAASDLGNAAITGYWGASGVDSWGAGLGWWLLLVGVILGIVGALVPFLTALRRPMARMPPPPPREWQVER